MNPTAPPASAFFIEQALVKVYSRGDRTIKSVAEELNINLYCLKNWMRIKSASIRNSDNARAAMAPPAQYNQNTPATQATQTTPHQAAPQATRFTKEKRPKDWTAQEQLIALHETHGLSNEALQAWCRRNGLFSHHLSSWRAAFCADPNPNPNPNPNAKVKIGVTMRANASTSTSTAVTDGLELRAMKDQIDNLKRELLRKDKALAEAAALLILQKKFRALMEDEAI